MTRYKLKLYTKQRCHLCDEMKEVLMKIRNDIMFELEEIDIKKNEDLYEQYKEKIPVLMINDKMFAKYRVDEDKLRKKLIFNPE